MNVEKIVKIRNEYEIEKDGKKEKRVGYNFKLILDNGNSIAIKPCFKSGYYQLMAVAVSDKE